MSTGCLSISELVSELVTLTAAPLDYVHGGTFLFTTLFPHGEEEIVGTLVASRDQRRMSHILACCTP